MTNPFHKFYKKTVDERWETLRSAGLWDGQQGPETLCALPPQTADQMIENYLGTYHLPFGVAPNFLIDGVDTVVPMVTEEPSVIAAASFGAQIVRRAGGFHTDSSQRAMIGQIALQHISDPDAAIETVLAHRDQLLRKANDAYPSIVTRGGGAYDLSVRYVDTDPQRNARCAFLIIYLTVSVQEAMGANILNTMLEALIPEVTALTGGQALMGILSNYATSSLVSARCAIPVRLLATATLSGADVAQRIADADQLAMADPYRATTHNKGIMNGIDAVVIASGNDWRAIEAGAHAYACRNGFYQPLSRWQLDAAGKELIGELCLPLPVGSVGGSISLHPTAQFAHRLLHLRDAAHLASVIVSVGLAQNLAALRALVTEGIQKGHMTLQLKSLALSSGATHDELPHLLPLLAAAPHRNLATAQQLLAELRRNLH